MWSFFASILLLVAGLVWSAIGIFGGRLFFPPPPGRQEFYVLRNILVFIVPGIVVAGIGTSFVERQNLTMRMSMRRFTRLTNAFSKKLDNHKAAVALSFVWYNYARIHQTLRVTPMMEAGISGHVWSAGEIVRLAE